jgi:hypothetical protein
MPPAFCFDLRMSKPPKKISEIPITRQEYYRLLAEVRTLTVFVKGLHAASLVKQLPPCENTPDKSQEAQEYQEYFETAFDESFPKLVAITHSKILEQIEDISPRIAAELDDRSADEIV